MFAADVYLDAALQDEDEEVARLVGLVDVVGGTHRVARVELHVGDDVHANEPLQDDLRYKFAAEWLHR